MKFFLLKCLVIGFRNKRKKKELNKINKYTVYEKYFLLCKNFIFNENDIYLFLKHLQNEMFLTISIKLKVYLKFKL